MNSDDSPINLLKARREVYSGRVVDLTVDTLELPSGHRFDLEQIHHPGGAAVAAVDAEGRVCLVRQYRHAASRWLWELPAGKVEGGEPHDQTARRELAEEGGVLAGSWQFLGSVITSPGVFREWIHLYLARDLQPSDGSPDPDEWIEVHWRPLDEALQWALDGTIEDSKSVSGLMRSARVLGLI